MQNKKSSLIFASIFALVSAIITTVIAIISYRLGYCNAADDYIDASECKPMRNIKLFY